jgi:hypothetical protein
MSKANYDSIIKWEKSILSEENRLKKNFYTVKSMIKPFGLGYQKIDMRLNFCMLYYDENINLTECKTYGHTWYKSNTSKGMTFITYKKPRYFSITHWLERLFMSLKTFEHMTYNHSHEAEDRVTMFNDKA